jgi:hypothetical protein
MTDRRDDLHDKIAERDAGDWVEIAMEFGALLQTFDTHPPGFGAMHPGVQRMAEEIVRLREELEAFKAIGVAVLGSASSFESKLKAERAYSAKLRGVLAAMRDATILWPKDQASSTLKRVGAMVQEALAIKPPGGDE